MMKRLLLISGFLFCAALYLMAPTVQAQPEVRASPAAKVSQTIGTTVVDISYSRPGVKGRQIFGDLVPWGQPWRAGANEPTTFTFSNDVVIQGQPLEAGTYNFFVRPAESGDWEAIFTTEVRWGTQFDQAEPVLTVNVTPQDAPAQEWLIYRFENLSPTSADLILHWADKQLPITIQVGN